MRQRQPRRAARMRGRTDRRADQDRATDRAINIRVPDDTHAPVAGIQLPLGLNLPASAKPQVNDGKMVDLQIQTCEQRGCYVNTPIALDMLAAMKTGKVLKVSFQNRSKEVIAIPMPLTDFAAA
jgi:invasion protein IalB